jgi:hypothetical protein
VANAGEVQGPVAVDLDGVRRNALPTGKGLLSPVFPGDHYLYLTGQVQGKPVGAGSLVKVDPGQTTSVELTLQ